MDKLDNYKIKQTKSQMIINSEQKQKIVQEMKCTDRISPNTAVKRVKIRYTLKIVLTQNGDKSTLAGYGEGRQEECN